LISTVQNWAEFNPPAQAYFSESETKAPANAVRDKNRMQKAARQILAKTCEELET
jgi:hypothetical protein